MLSAPQLFYADMSVTRALAAQLTSLRAAGKTIHHLGAGYPHPEASAADEFHRVTMGRLARLSAAQPTLLNTLYGYTDTAGLDSVRHNFARLYGADFGVRMDPACLIPTIGATGGIDQLCSLFESAYGRLAYLCDAPTYAGFVSRALKRQNAEPQQSSALFSVPCDSEGPDPEALARKIVEARAADYFVPFYYTIPDGHNPSGLSFSAERRQALYRVALEKNILIVEDAPYTYINFAAPEERPQPLFAMDPENIVVHLFTASKISVPGPRVAFMYAPGQIKTKGGKKTPLKDLLMSGSAASILMHSAFALSQFEQYLHNDAGELRSSIWELAAPKINVYRENRDILLAGLQTYFSADEATWTIPQAGFFIVIRFNPQLGLPPSPELSRRLLAEYGVTSVAMPGFYPSDIRNEIPGIGNNELRLSFSFTEGSGNERVRAMQSAVDVFAHAVHAAMR